MTSLSTLAGTFVGILTSATDSNGWEYFAAVMILILFSSIGLILGGIIQIIAAIMSAKTKRITLRKTPKRKILLDFHSSENCSLFSLLSIA